MQTIMYEITCKNDTDKTNFMYLPFPANKNINPKHWDSKLKFWTLEIVKSRRFLSDICLSCEKLRETFCCENKRSPAGLMTVLDELYNSGDILLASDFVLFDDSWTQWGIGLVSKSSSWLWKKVWYDKSFNEQTLFVVKELLEEFGLALLAAHYKQVKYEKTDNVVPWKVLQTVYKINGQTLPENNLLCIIGHLRNKGKCKVALMDNGEKIVKFLARNQQQISLFTDIDFEIIKLKKAIAKLTLECSQLDGECKKLQQNAKACVGSDKVKAKRILAEKHKIEKALKMKNDALFSMKENLRIIQETETTMMITDAFNSSAALLNNSYKAQGLTVSHVDDVMDKVSEATEMVNEIEEALSSGIKHLGDDYDMDELEKELLELDIDHEEHITSLPDVPGHSPQKKENILSQSRVEAVPAT